LREPLCFHFHLKGIDSMMRSLMSMTVMAAWAALSLGVSGLAEEKTQSILKTAEAAGSFKTLVKAVKAADLEKVLDAPGPFTVFAPTDEAFAAVPKETLEALLADPKQLAAVLTYHVVPGEVMAADVVKLKTAKTAQGESVKILAGKTVTVNDAKVVKTDIRCSNGVIHVIDAVLLPPKPETPATKRGKEALKDASTKNPAEQIEALQAAIEDVQKLAKENVEVQETLREALAQAKRLEDAGAKALVLQGALSESLETLEFKPFQEARLPKGFLEPTPVGEIRVKQYPAYRLARTEMPAGRLGEGRAFFALFEHIVRNKIEMTAPVELTYSSGKDMPRGEAMAFLYEDTELGSLGSHGGVEVVDVPAMTTLSIGVRGDHAAEAIEEARERLERWLEQQDQYKAAGKLRVMGYNSPMVPVERRYLEVEIPVRR
jgi:uncharacterized surface protein with fasciclin (FAS1) repeats